MRVVIVTASIWTDRESRGSYFYVAPSTINNGVCAYYQQQRGLIPREWMQLDYPHGNHIKGYCGEVWSNRTLGRQLHFLFLNHPDRFTADAATGSSAHAAAHEILEGRFSINLIAFYASELVHMSGLTGADGEREKIRPDASTGGEVTLGRVLRNDEEEMSVTIPERIGRQNAIYHPLVVAHLSSSQQEAKTIVNGNCYDTGLEASLSEEAMPVEQLLELYTALADRTIGQDPARMDAKDEL
jgi:hypothetical protein